MPGYIHHIQWCVASLEDTLETMIEGYKFKLLAAREGENKEAVLQSGDIRFLVSERTDTDQPGLVYNYPWLRCSCRSEASHHIDSVFNVCLEVSDVDITFNNMQHNGSEVLHPPTTITTSSGSIRYAVVTSPCDNLVHSLVNTKDYTGTFLPGFTVNVSLDEELDNDIEQVTHIDHLTYVVKLGDTDRILDWYQKCCGMKRFLMNPDEDPAIDDFVMRLNAGNFLSEWMCREDGVMWQGDEDLVKRNFKLVLAEPLPDREESQVHR